jgi:hypothetical protein
MNPGPGAVSGFLGPVPVYGLAIIMPSYLQTRFMVKAGQERSRQAYECTISQGTATLQDTPRICI